MVANAKVLDIAEQGAKLRLTDGLIEVALVDGRVTRVALPDLAAITLTHPAIMLTKPLLAALANAGIPVIICDEGAQPVSLCCPIVGYHAPAQRLAAQAAAPKPLCKRLWQQIVRAKIQTQASVLKDVRGKDYGLSQLLQHVRSGDPTNVEARAARIYWPALFDDPAFLRRRDLPDQNRYLNYAYAIVRAAAARAIVAAGLHPGLGVHHHHRNNPFPLADDLMEPFRPLADQFVVQLIAQRGRDAPLDRPAKTLLLSILSEKFHACGESRLLSDILNRVASAIAISFEQRKYQPLPFPKW